MIPRPHAIEIDGGVISRASNVGMGGIRPLFSPTGQFRFFVDVIEEHGGRFGMWDGTSYEEAIRTAEALRIDFGITEAVRDVIGGAA